MFLPEHLSDFWNNNPKWVTDYFVKALRYPRLEIIVRAIMQEHLAGKKSYLMTVTAHVNPQSHTGEGTNSAKDEGGEDDVGKTSGESSGEAAREVSGGAARKASEDQTEAKEKEEVQDDETDGGEGPSKAEDNELSDVAKKLLF